MDKLYHFFFGIDIAKSNFVVANSFNAQINSFPNTYDGHKNFFSTYKEQLKSALVVLEATGGYENELIDFLIAKGCKIHKGHASKIKNFAKSFGIKGKTDAVDAKTICRYAEERHTVLRVYETLCKEHRELKQLLNRREAWVAMRVQEKNRYQSPNNECVKEETRKAIETLDQWIKGIDERIQALENRDKEIIEKKEILEEIKGVGDKVSRVILNYLPEIGKIGRREIASLVGIAPHPRDSGNKKGYRGTWGGREIIRKHIFLAALVSARVEGELKRYYDKLIKKGKAKMVALVALMRKIITIANAKMKNYYKKKRIEQEV